MSELKPTVDNLSDPYVIQLITELSKLDDEIERLTAELDATQANEQRLADANKPLLAEVYRLRAALWEEYRDGFNDLGPTRQVRWKSAEEYADALMTDFDRCEALQGESDGT